MKTFFAALALAGCALPALAQQTGVTAGPVDPLQLQDRLTGDLGAGVFSVDRNGPDPHRRDQVLPYAYFDYGRFFARLDTFGVKTVRVGYGYLELAARATSDGFDAQRGVERRSHALPLGIGTYQETPVGAFFFNVFRDFNKSHGTLAEAMYAAQFTVGPVNFYPQAGVQYRSGSYNDYFVGISPSEAAASGLRQYSAGASTSPMLGLAADVPLTGDWHLNLQWYRKWLDNALADSPLVRRHTDDTAILAVTYHFK
ncbi:MipA/OmpV family protein [Herbaspirillum sp. DW155]|uniref:MipA/OmpV family protein n=1 Tax=Herbaspirillum sp. DW155 TaxID=3095609 RepID=UPI0030897FF6|nr:MipA/OmpV family protein [Herbaspirillum sp. DW155]